MDKETQVRTDEPKQVTPKGKEIPLPKREQVLADFKKIVRSAKPVKPTKDR